MKPEITPRQKAEKSIRDYLVYSRIDPLSRPGLLTQLYHELDRVKGYVVNRPKEIVCRRRPTEMVRLSQYPDASLKGVQLRELRQEEIDEVYDALAARILSEKEQLAAHIGNGRAGDVGNPVPALTVDGLTFRIEETIKEVCCGRRSIRLG